MQYNQRHNDNGRNQNGNRNTNNYQNTGGNGKRNQASAAPVPNGKRTNAPAINVIKDDYGSANGNNQHQDQDYGYNNNYNNYADDEYIDIREDEDTVSYDTNYDSGN